MRNEPGKFSGSILNAPACMLGEGPTYDPHTQTAWWFDIVGRKLIEYALADNVARTHDLPVMGSVLARVDHDRQVIATETGLHLRQCATGKLELITPIEADNPVTRSNDGRVHACGALWIGTMGKNAEKHAGAIYHVARGVVTRIFPDITIPNSICFSPDGALAYFTDTDTNKLMRVAIDPETALPVAEPVVFLDDRGEGGIDGSVCDADGVLWNARWGGGRIDAYSPQGKLLMSLDVPAGNTTCPAFVGKDASQLLVTSARQGLSAAQLGEDLHAGSSFLLSHKVKGRFEPDYSL